MYVLLSNVNANVNVEWCFVIGQHNGNSAHSDVGVGVMCAQTSCVKSLLKRYALDKSDKVLADSDSLSMDFG